MNVTRQTQKMRPGWMVILLVFGLCVMNIQAQWQTQPLGLKAGWNPVYLHVDATYDSISNLVENEPIEAIWLWSPSASEAQYVLSPDAPSAAKSRWIEWKSSLGDSSSALKRLVGNSAYLIKVSDGSAPFTWNLKGKPMPPVYHWTTSGLNLVGFPVHPDGTFNLESYFAKAGSFLSSATFYNYTDGDLGPTNPVEVFGPRSTTLPRGRAFWVDTGLNFNQYYAPYEIDLQNFKGVYFGENLQTYRIRFRNQTSAALTIQIGSIVGEAAPAGQDAEGDLQGALMIRGAYDADTKTYAFNQCPCSGVEVELAAKGEAGQEVEVVLGLDRTKLPGNSGSISSAILRIEDKLGHSRIDVPVRATKRSYEGLWVGDATVKKVSRANVDEPEPVSTAYPLRFIMHQQEIPVVPTESKAAGEGVTVAIVAIAHPLSIGEIVRFANGTQMTLTAVVEINGTSMTGNIVGDNGIVEGARGRVARLRMLQRIYAGQLPGGVGGITNVESELDAAHLGSATRISVAHLPFSDANVPWVMQGILEQGSTLQSQVVVAYDDQIANPFLHTYHPDHDNLNANFDAQLAQGVEAYRVQRDFTFSISQGGQNFRQIVSLADSVSGNYREVLKLTGEAADAAPNVQTYYLEGTFQLNRISSIQVLTQP